MYSTPKRKSESPFTTPRKTQKLNFIGDASCDPDLNAVDVVPPPAPRKTRDVTRIRDRAQGIRITRLDFDAFDGPGWSEMPKDIVERIMKSTVMTPTDTLNMALVCKQWTPSGAALARILCSKRIIECTMEARAYSNVMSDMFFGEFFEEELVMEILKSAIRNGSKSMIHKIISGKLININSTDESGQSILCTAIACGQFDILKSLIEDYAACVNMSDHFGETPIMRAVCEGTCEMVDLLIQHGANVNAQAYDLVSPLYLAVIGAKPLVAESLLRNGASVDMADSDGDTPLFMAARGDHVEIMKLLIANGADMNIPSSFTHETPLHTAASCGNVEIMEILVDNGATSTSVTIDGKTILHSAVIAGQYEAAEYILNLKSIDINAVDDFEKTALNYAVSSLNQSCITLLLDHGADPFVDNSWILIGMNIGWKNIKTKNEDVFGGNPFLKKLFCGYENKDGDD